MTNSKPQVPVVVNTVPRDPRHRKKDIMIAMPWYKSTNPLTAFSVMGLIDRSRTAVCMNFGDAFIVHSRNTLADMFLQSKLEWMLTIDDDMVVPFGNGKWLNSYGGFDIPKPFCDFNTIDRLMSHDKTLVGALYFGRWRSGGPMFAEGMRNGPLTAYARKGPYDKLLKTKWVGTGCMLIHRSVFLDIEKKFPSLARNRENGTRGGNWFTSSEHEISNAVNASVKMLEEKPGDPETAINVLQRLLSAQNQSKDNSSLGTGEDVIFCNRARVSGHQPHVDLGLVCGHVGSDVFGPQNTV
jgi:hypothetical protein